MTDRGIRIDKVWVAVDVGKVVDPVNFENQVQGGVVWGSATPSTANSLTQRAGRSRRTTITTKPCGFTSVR